MFILFFGTRPGKTQQQQLSGVQCPYCERVDTLTAYSTPTYFHLFWLPIFKVSTNVTAECSHCRRGYFQDEFSREMQDALY